ncbi:MAG: HAD family hydrolase [Fibrobacterota bacterium]
MNLPDFTTVLWDFNGTIIDDVDLCYDLYLSSRKKYGLRYMSRQEYRYHFSFPVIDFYTHAGFCGSPADYSRMAGKFIQSYDRQRADLHIHNGIEAVLHILRERRIPMHIISAYRQENLREFVQALGLNHYFAGVHGLTNTDSSSKLRRTEMVLQDENIDPRKALFIGDTVHDWEVALAVGAFPVLIAQGHNSMKRLQQECEGAVILENAMDLEYHLYRR